MALGKKEEAFKYLELSCNVLSTTSIMKIRVANCYRHYDEYEQAKAILEKLIADEDYQDYSGFYLLAKNEFYAVIMKEH